MAKEAHVAVAVTEPAGVPVAAAPIHEVAAHDVYAGRLRTACGTLRRFARRQSNALEPWVIFPVAESARELLLARALHIEAAH
jgi:hypothetical protein